MQPVNAEFLAQIGRQIAFLNAFLRGRPAPKFSEQVE